MNKLTWGTVLALALATMAGPVFADNDRHGRGHRDHDRREYRHDRRDDRRVWQGDRRGHDRRHYERDRRHDRAYRHDRHYRAPVRVVHHYAPPPRYVAPPRWARGGYVHHYQRPIYVVHDYRGYGLRHPPRGHRWMRDDRGDLLLVAIATGLIADLVLR